MYQNSWLSRWKEDRWYSQSFQFRSAYALYFLRTVTLHNHIYIYIYICVCVCVCVCASKIEKKNKLTQNTLHNEIALNEILKMKC